MLSFRHMALELAESHPTPLWQTPFKAEVLARLKNIITKIAPDFDVTQLGHVLGVPPSFELGQLAFPCFPLAKTLRSAPPKIAAQLVQEFKQLQSPLIKDVRVAGGYINFFLNFEASAKTFHQQILQSKYFDELGEVKREQIDVEYSQPNTHKALHLGHMRNLFYGDAVCNLLDRVGCRCIRTTYPGDLGTHIARVLWFIKKIPRDTWPTGDEKAIWLGKQYALSTETMNALPEAEKESAGLELQNILKNLQDKSGSDYDLYLETRQWSLGEMARIYAWSTSIFDRWYFESECDEASRLLVQEQLDAGVFEKSDGAVGVQLGPELGFALLLKRDGNGIYLTKDLELIRRKFSDPKTTKALYIVDSRQKLHFKQLFAVAERMGFPQAKRSEHLSYENVNNEQGEAFSSRDARGMSLEELRSHIESIVQTDYLERHRAEWPAAELTQTAENITLAALKYGMLRVDPSSPIKFILAQWISLEGETGPYLQYVITRCKSLLARAGTFADHGGQPEHPTEQELFYALYRYNEIVESAALEYRPNHLANYLFDIAKLFNRFYKECPVLTAEGEVRNARLSLVKLAQTVLEDGFKLLNIPAIDRM